MYRVCIHNKYTITPAWFHDDDDVQKMTFRKSCYYLIVIVVFLSLRMDVNVLWELNLKTTYCMTREPRFPLGICRVIRVLGLRTYYGLRSAQLIYVICSAKRRDSARNCLQGCGDGTLGNRIFHVLVRVAAFSPCTAEWFDQVRQNVGSRDDSFMKICWCPWYILWFRLWRKP